MNAGFARIRRDEEGQTTLEYGIVLGVVLVAVAAAVALYGQAIAAFFARLIEQISRLGT